MLGRIVTAAALAAGGVILSKKFKSQRGRDLTSNTEQSIDINVPLSTAYNQWTQFEEFPKFMDSVLEVRQLDDRHLHWRAKVAGKEEEWDCEITEQVPDQRIAWRSTSGTPNSGVVTFHKISDTRTRVMLQMDYEPQDTGEKLGAAAGLVKAQAKANLRRFKSLLEGRGSETGAWRGSIARH